MIALGALIVLLSECSLCGRLGGDFQLEKSWLVVAGFLVASIGIFNWLHTRSTTKYSKAINVLLGFVVLSFLLAFPVIVLVGASWDVMPCIICGIFWISLGVLALRLQLLGRFRLVLIASSLILAGGGTAALRGTEYEVEMRRNLVRDFAEQIGLVKVGDRWLPKVGDVIPGLPSTVSGLVLVATHCPTCLKKGMGRLMSAARVSASDVLILAPEDTVVTEFRKVFPVTRDIVINRHAWMKFHMEPFGAPYLYVIQNGRVLKRLP
jgi:hypothetical protein